MKNLTKAQVIDLLRKAQGKQSLRGFSESLGLSAAYLSDVYHGNREPGPTILEHLGVERTKTIEVTYTQRKN